MTVLPAASGAGGEAQALAELGCCVVAPACAADGAPLLVVPQLDAALGVGLGRSATSATEAPHLFVNVV